VALSVKLKQGQASARKKQEEGALSLLMDIALNRDFGESLDVEPRPESVQAIYAQVEPLIESLPAKQRPVTEEVFHRWAEARDMMTQVGEQEAGQQITQENAEALINAAYEKRQEWLKKIDIDTNPRYAPDEDGFPGAGDGSVSRASSDFAKSATATEPDATWVGGLPASQRCG
jgi:23S rRNA G2069 N7-methylase RlmK/C1962 C5-methylase RlmI